MPLCLVRTRCKTCTRSYDPRELLPGAQICSICLLARVAALNNANLSRAAAEQRCQSCGRNVLARAYAHWDVGANDFAYLCIPCADEAIQRAAQYRGTPFGRDHKAE